ncbi:MAG: DUF3987 domain-containing protein [Firmicutes bacterium]|nr:DUF3987 domain-containing protein [Bacillota bacterium]
MLNKQQVEKVISLKQKLEGEARPPANKEVKFPESAYCGLAAEFAEVFSTYTETPKASYYISFLTFLGLLFSGKVTLQSQLNVQPRLYVVILGKSGIARKSEAIKQTARFFKSLVDGKPSWYPMMTGIGSVEGAADKWNMEEKESGICRCLLCFDELKIFVDKAKTNGSILLPMITSLFEQNSYENITRTFKNVNLQNLHLGLIAACTIETYERMWEPQFLDIGFINRLFLVADAPDKRIALPEEIPGHLINPLREKTFRLIQHVANLPGVTKLVLTPEAKELWSSWYRDMPQDIYAVRLDSIGLRLMPLLAVNEGSFSEVGAGIVRKVIAILEYQYVTRKLYDPIDAETKTAQLEEKIRRILSVQPATKRDLQRRTHANRIGLWFFNQALNNLQANGEAFFDKKTRMYQLEIE